jgi:hypothetical protein
MIVLGLLVLVRLEPEQALVLALLVGWLLVLAPLELILVLGPPLECL